MTSAARAARAVPGLRSLRRPYMGAVPAFDLAYLRPAPGRGPVVLQIAGGPGIAVPLMYRSFRTDAAERGLDVIMVEHRGVGLSRAALDGTDLPREAITSSAVVDDLLAVLDAEGIDQAIISGASYGSYLAAALAVTAPERVAGLVLDSTVLGAADVHEVRAWSRALLRDGAIPEAAHVARKIRILLERDHLDPDPLGQAATTLFEAGGTDLLERWLDQLVVRRSPLMLRTVRAIQAHDTGQRLPHVVEVDLVAQIAYGELDYAAEPDGKIFDPSPMLAMAGAPPFTGEHFALRRQLTGVTAPAVVIGGSRDLRTPPTIAALAARTLPDALRLEIPGHGHSALDTRPGVLLDVLCALGEGRRDDLAGRGAELAARHRPAGGGRWLPPLLRSVLAVERALVPFPRTPRGLR